MEMADRGDAFIAGERAFYLSIARAALAKRCEVKGPIAGQRECQNVRALDADIAEIAPLAAHSEWKFDNSLYPQTVLPAFLLPPFAFAQKMMLGQILGTDYHIL